MVRTTLFVCALAACSSGRTSDQELGALVVAPDETMKPIDVAKAAREPAELGRAITLPDHEVEHLLGLHVTVIKNTTVVTEGAAQVDALTVETTIELGDGGAWHALANNTADYGREAVFSGGSLYLRPRYAKWHKRAPNDKHEAAALRDDYAAELAAAWDLLAPGVELSDRGARTVAGRGGRVIELKLAPSPRRPASEPLVQRKWRESRVVEAVAGEVVLDADTGAVLTAKLTGKLAFVRDGRRFELAMDIAHDVRAVGTPVAIAVPPPAETVATPERLKEVEDRDAMLKGIAPPIGAQRDDDGAGAGSAAPAPTPIPGPSKSPSKPSP